MPNNKERSRKEILSLCGELESCTTALYGIRHQMRRYVVWHSLFLLFYLISAFLGGQYLNTYDRIYTWIYFIVSVVYYFLLSIYYNRLQKFYADIYSNNHKYASNLLSVIIKLADWESLRKKQLYHGVDNEISRVVSLYYKEVQCLLSPSRYGVQYYRYLTTFQILIRLTVFFISIYFAFIG